MSVLERLLRAGEDLAAIFGACFPVFLALYGLEKLGDKLSEYRLGEKLVDAGYRLLERRQAKEATRWRERASEIDKREDSK